MSFVVGYVAAGPTANRDLYRRHVEESAAIFKEHGALQFVECWGVDVPEGTLTSFPLAVKCHPDETVVFAWIRWESREARADGMAKVRSDPRMKAMFEGDRSAPYDMSRMIHGGFEVIVEL